MRTVQALVAVLIAGMAAALALPGPAAAETPAAELVGQGGPDFSLPSQQDRLVVYEKDYYGKHHLVLTFFPAAFTPV